MYAIRLFTLGPKDRNEPDTHTIDRSTITARELETGLTHFWAWNGVLKDADGPAVAVEFPAFQHG